MPVLPPIEESTWDKSVVGIFINFIPLLKILDAKPLTSPVIPPPIDIKQSSLEKFLFNKISKILLIILKFLLASLAIKKHICIFFLLNEFFILVIK